MTTPPNDADRTTEARADSLDDELRAMQTVLSALAGLEPDGRQRVIDYVFQRLGLQATKGAMPASVGPQQPTTKVLQSEPFSGQIRDIRSLKETKKPRSAVEMAVLVAYYLSEVAPEGTGKTEIGTDEITTYFKQAGYPLPSSPRHTLFKAKSAGYLDASAHGAYKLNPVGHNLIAHTLPADRASTSKARGSRGGNSKAGARKGKSRRAKRTSRE